jgi:hypothetical protein
MVTINSFKLLTFQATSRQPLTNLRSSMRKIRTLVEIIVRFNPTQE